MIPAYVEIKLKSEWLSHPKGSILCLKESAANELIRRKAAVLVEKKEEKGAKTKDIVSPPKDKMMRPVRQKRVN